MVDYYEQFVWASIGFIGGMIGLGLIYFWLIP